MLFPYRYVCNVYTLQLSRLSANAICVNISICVFFINNNMIHKVFCNSCFLCINYKTTFYIRESKKTRTIWVQLAFQIFMITLGWHNTFYVILCSFILQFTVKFFKRGCSSSVYINNCMMIYMYIHVRIGTFLAHLTQRVMWAIAITWRPSSVVRCPSYIVNFLKNLLLWKY